MAKLIKPTKTVKTVKPTLKIVIKGEYFDMIKAKSKIIEYREVTQFWISRLYDKNGKKNNDTTFNLEENMIPAGFMFFVLSMLIYFVDTTS